MSGGSFNGVALDTASLSKIGSYGILSGTYTTKQWASGSFSGGVYTIPRAGLYLVIMELHLDNILNKYAQVQLYKSNKFDSIFFWQNTVDIVRTFEAKAVHAIAGDTIGVYIHTGSAVISVPLTLQIVYLGGT